MHADGRARRSRREFVITRIGRPPSQSVFRLGLKPGPSVQHREHGAMLQETGALTHARALSKVPKTPVRTRTLHEIGAAVCCKKPDRVFAVGSEVTASTPRWPGTLCAALSHSPPRTARAGRASSPTPSLRAQGST